MLPWDLEATALLRVYESRVEAQRRGVSLLPREVEARREELRRDLRAVWTERLSQPRKKMAHVTIAGGQAYTMPFDSIDTQYLGRYVDRPTETVPLWTRRKLDGETEYCQVQLIVAQNDENCFSEPTETYVCQICNVHVPKICSEEHNASEQHEIMKKIHQKILEKVSKHIDTNVENNNQRINTDEYYCVPCSKIIKKENKENHETTEYHAKSKKDTIIINEFFKIIREDKTNDENIIINGKNTGDKNKYLKENLDVTVSKNISNHNVENNRQMTENLSVPGPSNINKPSEEHNANSFEVYLKAMLKKYNITAKVPLMVGEGVKMESKTGVVVVSQENFHSYKQLKNCTYCQMCKMWISEDTISHDVSENHVRNIFKPVNEKFTRMIDSISSHCVPCNEVVITDSTHHVLSENHKKIIKDTRVQKSNQTFCKDCSVFIDNHNYDIHINSKKHLNVLVKQNSLAYTNIAKVFLCNICNVNVPKNDVSKHVNTNTHLAKKTKNAIDVNEQNGSTVLSVKNTAPAKDKKTIATKVNGKNNSPSPVTKRNTSEYCNICKVAIPNGGKKIHEDGKPHKNKINDLIEIKMKAKKNINRNASDMAASTGAATIVPNEKLEEYYDQLEYANDLNTEVRCKICLVYMPFIDRIVVEHMESEGHKELATEFKMDEYNKFLCYTDDAKTKVLCEICYVYIPNNDRNIIEHIEGKNHESAKIELLEFHSMKTETDGYVCESCDVHTKDFIGHINSRSHNLTLLKTEEIDKLEMRRYVYVDEIDDVVSRRYRDLYKNLLKHNGIYKLNDTSHYCGMCQIKLGRTCEIDHVFGERHLLKLGEVTRLSSLLKVM